MTAGQTQQLGREVRAGATAGKGLAEYARDDRVESLPHAGC